VKPDTRTVRQLFELDVRYVVPRYQRPYVWDAERQWQPLWEDVEVILEHRLNGSGADDDFSHFLGAIVLEQELQSPGSIPVFTIIDGQQRLATLQLLLGAACMVALKAGAEKEAAILHRLTENDELTAEGIERFKVWPTNANRAAFEAVMQEGGPPDDREDDPHNRIDEAYAFFCAAISEWLADAQVGEERAERIKALRITLSDLLKVVSITLEPGDNAQIIFETLNARGTPLLALDLVKNAVFHAAERQGLQTESLYHEEWRPELDQRYWRQERRQGRLNRPLADLFLMHWLAMKLHEVVPANELFARFRQRILGTPEPPPADELIRELRRDAQIMRSFEQQPPGSVEATFFERLELLDTSVVLPLVLLLFRDKRISPERRRRALRILESWLVRRGLMRLTVKNYNQQVPVMLARVTADPQHADVALLEYLRSGEGEISRWPTDVELREYLTTRPLYNNVATKKIVMALAAVEQTLYSAKVDIPDVPKTLSLEHVIPQSWGEHWPLPSDGDPIELRTQREEHLHRLGNLTLTAGALNTALSNAPWAQKRTALNKESKLLLNVELIESYPDSFDEAAVEERGARLVERICAFWPGPENWQEPGAAEDASAVSATAAGKLTIEEVLEPEPEVLEAELTRDGAASSIGVTLLERYAAVLKSAAPAGTVEIAHERGSGGHARLELASAQTVKYAYLDANPPEEVPLRIYPGDTLEQARLLYGEPIRCERLLTLRERGWEIQPNFHFGFMTRGLSWSRSALGTDDYVAYWMERIGTTTAIPREDWDGEIRRLIEDGIFSPGDLSQFDADFRNTERGSASPRPGLMALRRWPLDALDDPDFPLEVRSALHEALGALREPTAILETRSDVADGAASAASEHAQ
jgi:hypothetical protein